MDVLAPTLIIGLGGNGSKIVSQVAKNTNEEQRRYIRFVVFDTDANDLRELKEHGYIGKTVQTSKKMTVGEYLENDQHARENWFPVNRILCRKALSEGAGQVRAISRLALDTAIHSGAITPLHEAIYQHVRKEVAFYEVDREIWPDIRAVEKMIRSGELLDIVKEYIPDFE